MSEALIKAVAKNDIAEVERLLADSQKEGSQIDVNYKFKTNTLEGNVTALHIAAMKGHTQILKLLLDNEKVDKSALTSFGSTALHCAVTFGQVEACEMLLTKVNAAKRDNGKKLAYFLAKEKEPRARSVDEKKNFVKIMNLLRVPTFVTACCEGDLDIAKKMVEEKVDVNGIFKTTTGLFGACLYLQVGVVEYLIKLPEIDANAKDPELNTILHLLSNCSSTEKIIVDSKEQSKLEYIAELLIENGADVNAKNDIGGTPLLTAAIMVSHVMLKVLMKHGADINIKYYHPDYQGKEFAADILDIAKDRGMIISLKFYKRQAGVIDVTTNKEKLNSLLFKHKDNPFFDIEIQTKKELTA